MTEAEEKEVEAEVAREEEQQQQQKKKNGGSESFFEAPGHQLE